MWIWANFGRQWKTEEPDMLQSTGSQSQTQCDFSRYQIMNWWFFSVFQHFHCAVLLPFNLHYLWWKANIFYTCVSMCYFLYIRSLFFGYFYDSLFILRLQQFDRMCLCAFFCVILHVIGEGNGNPLQCSCLENPRDGGAWWAAVSGVAQSQTRPKWLSSSIAASCMWLTGFLGFISEYLWSNFRNLRPLFLQILFLPCFFPFFSRTLITIILDEIIFINRPLGICSFHLNCFLPPHLVDEIISIHLLSKSSNCSFMFNMLLSTSNEFFMLLHFSVLVFHLLPFNSFNFSAEILHQFIYHAYILFKIFEHICNITQMHRTRPKTTNYPASKVNSAEAGKSCIIGS